MNAEFALKQMVRQQVRTWDVLDRTILQVMTDIPRGRFVPLAYLGVAYADCELPLEHGRMMLPPNKVGRILQALDVQPSDAVLQIGTGSGYVAACLATLGKSVESIDIQKDFIEKSAQVCDDLGINNIQFRHQTDFSTPRDQQFDVIMHSGSVAAYDASLEQLLKPAGRLFVTVGESPTMDAMLVRKVDAKHCVKEFLFETDCPSLTPGKDKQKFEF